MAAWQAHFRGRAGRGCLDDADGDRITINISYVLPYYSAARLSSVGPSRCFPQRVPWVTWIHTNVSLIGPALCSRRQIVPWWCQCDTCHWSVTWTFSVLTCSGGVKWFHVVNSKLEDLGALSPPSHADGGSVWMKGSCCWGMWMNWTLLNGGTSTPCEDCRSGVTDLYSRLRASVCVTT